MVKLATTVHLSPEQESSIRTWIKEAEQQQVRAERARIVLLAAEGWSTQQIARALGVRASRISRWRTRFAACGLAGLEDVARPGRPRSYDPSIDEQILSLAANPPPPPHPVWTGPLLAHSLGNVSAAHVWRVLREKGLSLRILDPREFETALPLELQIAGITGLYLGMDACGFLIGISEGARSPANMRLRSHIRVPTAATVSALRVQGLSARTLPEVLQCVTSLVQSGDYQDRDSRNLEDFLADARSHSATVHIHAFLLSPRALVFPGVYTHPLPAVGAWKGQLESWLTVFLPPENATVISQLVTAIENAARAYSGTPAAAVEWHAWPIALQHPGSVPERPGQGL